MSADLAGTKANIVKQFLTQNKSIDEFAAYFTPDALYSVGNAEPIAGRDRIQSAAIYFRQQVKSVLHQIQAIWEWEDTVICELEVTYTRHDGTVLQLPCLDVFHLQGNLFRELHVYIDISPIFT